MTTPGAKTLASVPTHTATIEGEGAVTWPTIPSAPAGASQSVVIAPMEIRTWMCQAS